MCVLFLKLDRIRSQRGLCFWKKLNQTGWLIFLLSDHALGISTAFAQSSGMLKTAVRGVLAGCAIYAIIYPWLERNILQVGSFGDITVDELFKTDPLKTMVGAAAVIIAILMALEFLSL